MLDYTQGGPLGTRYGVSPKGWMTETNYLDWFRSTFIPSLPPERPVLLIIDGHKTHIQYEVLQLAKANEIEIAKLPPHTTHLLQPLDLSLFKPMKEWYDREAHKLFMGDICYITKRDFPGLIGKVWNSYRPEIAINGFKKAGIYPFSREAVGVSALNLSIPFQSPNNTQHSPQQNAADQLELTNETDPALSTSSSEQPSVGESLVDQLLNDKENNDITVINTENPTTVMPSPTITTSSTIEQSTSTSSQVSSNLSSQSTSIKDLFLEFMKTKTPQSKKRGRSVASIGETLTAEEALRRQKETEDNKRRKEEEKEELKRIRMEKKSKRKGKKRKRKAERGKQLKQQGRVIAISAEQVDKMMKQ